MDFKNFSTTLAAIVLVAASGLACAVSQSAINDSQPNNSSGLSTTVLSTTGLGTASTISDAAGGFALGGGGGQSAGLNMKRFALSGDTGAAAAPGATRWNAWGAVSHSNIGYEFTPLQSSGNVNVYLLGVDYTLDSNMIVGVSVAADRTNVNLAFSGGTYSGSGTTVSPYLGVAINKNVAFDATIGYGRTDVDTAVGGVAGSTRSDRSVGALGLTYREVIDAWTLSARGAFLAVHDKLGAYTLSNGTFVPDGTVNVSQVRLLGQAAYTWGRITPYASLSYIYDIKHPDQAPVGGVAAANDRDGWKPAIGLRFKADNTVYGSFQYATERGRSEVKNDQFLFTLGARF